jgi:hypothetical protein
MDLTEIDHYQEIVIEELAKIRARILSQAEPSSLRWPCERVSLVLDGIRRKYEAIYENAKGANNIIPEVETET